MTLKNAYAREMHIVVHGQTAKFRLVKYAVLVTLAVALYFWKGIPAVGATLLFLALLGVGVHFVLRFKTHGWTRSWGPYRRMTLGHLVYPSMKYKKSFIEAVEEYQRDSTFSPMPDRHDRYRELVPSVLESNFESYVARLRGHERGENLPPGYVPVSEYWLVEGDECIGTVSVRHRLNPHLEKVGGHIGYDIRPKRRKQGYGSEILKLALEKAKELGIRRVLVTCDATNAGSRKIIEKNGGVLENRVPNPETGVDKLRFWITND